MSERIIPGTYITVRAEGLISAGRVATGIVGIVGTAASGPIGEPVTLSGYANALEVFGSPDPFDAPEDGANPLTLTRALEFLYNNGASSVIAVRVASDTAAAATYAIPAENGGTVAVLTANTPGSWANNLAVEVAPAEDDCLIEEVYTDTFDKLRRGNIVASPTNQVRVFRNTSKRMELLNIVYKGNPSAGQVAINPTSGELKFAANQAPAAGDRLHVTYLVNREACVEVNIGIGRSVERYTAPDGAALAEEINRRSRYVTAVADTTNGGLRPAQGTAYFGTGSNAPGNNGAGAAKDEYAAGLGQLSNQLVNIVVLAGQNAEVMGDVLQGHLNSTEQVDFERIGVIGAAGAAVADYLGHNVASERLILVAPGLRYSDGRTLPAAYTAAAVAGLIASLDVQASLTNKPLTIPGLSIDANRGEQGQLIRRNVLTIIRKDGYRVLKGITSAGEGTPFASIPTRRIVDYAKYGVRSAANPYIGRLNNDRVRSAMKATLDAFLTRMVEDEALTGYELEVSATRAQEIAGEVAVTMTLMPTFSIDYIRVTMNLK